MTVVRSWPGAAGACLLIAAMADYAGRAGVIAGTDAMSDEWIGYSDAEQEEILSALGAQVRVSLQLLRDKLGIGIEMDWTDTARAVCAEALAFARALVMSEEGPGPAPECAHCREVIGNGLCGLQIQACFLLGLTPALISQACRNAARYSVLPDVLGRHTLNVQGLGSVQAPDGVPTQLREN